MFQRDGLRVGKPSRAIPLLFASDWFRNRACSGYREVRGKGPEAEGKDLLAKFKEGKPWEHMCVLLCTC